MLTTVSPRIHPLRKPKGFEPVVQRWSAGVPAKHAAYTCAFYGVQAPDAEALKTSPFHGWWSRAATDADGPTVHDFARYTDEHGRLIHVVCAYWIDVEAFARWRWSVGGWWDKPARLNEPCGYFREELHVPVERQETLYWRDYAAGLSRSPEIALYPTPYCGYYGAMRDRIPLAATDPLERTLPKLPAPVQRESRGARWRVRPPENLAVIRSAAAWGAMDEEQHLDFTENLRGPLERGMQFLRDNAEETGCCTLRYQQTHDPEGRPLPEAHALGYFLSLGDLENWAERHASHHAIFSSAMARYRKYGPKNQLRTWHEVFVLPAGGHTFEYINCAPDTGLLPWFEAERVG